MVATLLWWLIGLFIWVLLARVILSWIPMFAPGWTPRGVVLVVVEFIYTVTDPPVKALQKVIKPIRIGGAYLDLSVLVLFIVLQIVQSMVWLIPF
ncbi:YggT family protein [Tessaracoccus lapidicaptus]|uniref:YggT family protein n=1 Tax=Tessaracoccus lapidicaptus TaxID=1427523 RepID=UPI00333EFC28